MTFSYLSLLALAAAGASALPSLRMPVSPANKAAPLARRDTSGLSPGCENGPTSRKCWGEYDINTDYYDTVFYTGKTVEYWLNVEEIDCAPDGYQRKCMVANGTMPGPAITADWGDEIIVHVTNNIATNGTAIHWHGMRQLNTNEYDGVPGVTQCPTAPGETQTYKFHASQYGTTWWHSHLTVQYSMGLHGPLIINGPASADYDEELPPILMTDWNHKTEFDVWAEVADYNVTFSGAETGLINGMNTGNCTNNKTEPLDPNCLSGGKKYEMVFEAGKKYRIRIINVATEAWFQWSIDGHTMTVIAADLVPIVPYQTDSVLINMGQRYDVIVEANAAPGDYWMRSGFIFSCIPNSAPDNMTAIVRYNNASTAEPTSVSTVITQGFCTDERAKDLVPWVPIDITSAPFQVLNENVQGEYWQGKFLRWSFNMANGGFASVNWAKPALADIVADIPSNISKWDNAFPVGYNASNVATYNNNSAPEWVVLVLEELTQIPGIAHPMHLHGHDFLLLSAGLGKWDGQTQEWNLNNPVRRDTATMPPNGHIALAFRLDNPGLWLFHCHIPWHSSQGFAATILESPALINSVGATSHYVDEAAPQCEKFEEWYATAPYKQDDSGV